MKHIEQHVDKLMENVRTRSPAWPPILDKSVEEGCRAIHEICQEEVMASIDDILKEHQIPNLSGVQSTTLQVSISHRVDVGLEKWKLCAQNAEPT